MELKLAETPDGKFFVYEGDYIGDMLLAGERWEPWVLDAIAGCADRSKVFIDAGGFYGTHAVFAASRFKHVHVFEPYPDFAKILRRNLALNGVTNVTVHEMALGRDERSVRMLDFANIDEIHPMNLGGLSSLTRQQDHSISASQVTLDSQMIANVGVIKIDTQGTEFRVLEGSRETIGRYRPIVFIEGSEKQLAVYGDSFRDVRRFFVNRKYKRLIRLKKNCADFMGVPKR